MSIRGWIIYNGSLPGNKFLDFAEMFHEAAKRRNITTSIYKNNELITDLNDDLQIIHPNDVHMSLPDFVIYTDKDIYLAKQLELLGVSVFNSADSIDISDDKIASYQLLAKHNIRIPHTIVAPKVYANSLPIDEGWIERIVEKLGLPMVIKEAYGSFGEQVYLVHTREEIITKIKEIGNKPFVFQEFIDSSYGKDLRLQVVGDQVVASMLRKSESDFRANVTAGGTMQTYEPNEREKEIAVLATKAIGADFAGVDLLFGRDQEPIVCEVNSNAHIRNMYNCTNINAADYVIDYILLKLEKS